MPFRAVCGRAGSGKTRTLVSLAGEDHKNGQPVYYIVPEQYTLQAERDLILLLDLKGLMDIEVISFERLALRAMEKTGALAKIRMSELSRSLVLRHITFSMGAQLTALRVASGKEGFAPRFSRLIGDMKRYDIAAGQVAQCSLHDELLTAKIADATKIYTKFEEFIQQEFINFEDVLSELPIAIEEYAFLNNACIYVDGFDTYTPQMLRVLCSMAAHCENVTMAFTLDATDMRYRALFNLEERAYQTLQQFCAQQNIEFEPKHLSAHSVQAKALRFLEQEAFVQGNAVYSDEAAEITLFSATDVRAEAEYAAAHIVSLVTQRKYRWRDIAVICVSLPQYERAIATAFERYEIPYFLDSTLPLAAHPIMDGIINCLAMIAQNFQTQFVLQYIKSGISALAHEDAAELENYALATGINQHLWTVDFRRGATRFDLAHLNTLRTQFIAPFLQFGVQKRSVSAFATDFYNLLLSLNIQTRLQEQVEVFTGQGNQRQALITVQVWQAFMDVLDQLCAVLGKTEATVAEFAAYITVAAQQATLASIPATTDEVQVGSLRRSKNAEIKTQLILGLTWENLTTADDTGNILSFDEMDELRQQGIVLGANQDELAENMDLNLYLAMARPTQSLYLSYAPASGADQPARVFSKLKGMFPKHSVVTPQTLVRNPQSALWFVPQALRAALDGSVYEDFFMDCYDWLCTQPQHAPYIQKIQKALQQQNSTRKLPVDITARLYPANFTTSVSRLESFAACPFLHFVRYTLAPQERELYGVSPSDTGLILHSVMEGVLGEIDRRGLDYKTLSATDCDVVTAEQLSAVMQQFKDGLLFETPAEKMRALRLGRIAARTVSTVITQIQQGDFLPADREMRFSNMRFSVPMHEGYFAITGIIDRIDTALIGNQPYVRIIDYKTGMAKLDWTGLQYGLSLQLPLYMHAYLQSNPQYKPAGIFQYHIDDPFLAPDTRDEHDLYLQRLAKLRLSGFMVSDAQVSAAMDADSVLSKKSSIVLPASVTKSSGFTSNYFLEEKQFGHMLQSAYTHAANYAGKIRQGENDIYPVHDARANGYTACVHCSYRAICQIDPFYTHRRYVQNVSHTEYKKEVT